MEISECFKIGYVAKSHGLKGEVTVVMAPDCPDLKDVKSVFVETSYQLVPYFIQSVSITGSKAYVKLEDVNSQEVAGALKGCSLFLSRRERPKLARGEFYNDEVIGFEVIDAEIGSLGLVNDILESGPNRYLTVMVNTKEVMIPLNGPFIKGVNKTRKKISVELPDGFLDI